MEGDGGLEPRWAESAVVAYLDLEGHARNSALNVVQVKQYCR